MKLSILGARVIDPSSGLDQVTDIHVEACKIVALGAAPAGFTAVETIDAQGLVAAPGPGRPERRPARAGLQPQRHRSPAKPAQRRPVA